MDRLYLENTYLRRIKYAYGHDVFRGRKPNVRIIDIGPDKPGTFRRYIWGRTCKFRTRCCSRHVTVNHFALLSDMTQYFCIYDCQECHLSSECEFSCDLPVTYKVYTTVSIRWYEDANVAESNEKMICSRCLLVVCANEFTQILCLS